MRGTLHIRTKRARGEFDAVVISIIAAACGLLLLMLPLFNKYVFKTINVDEIVIDGREGLRRVAMLQGEGKFPQAIDSANALIDRYTLDTLTFFTPDITSWDTVRAIVTGKRDHRWAHLIVGDMNREDIEILQKADEPFSQELKNRVVLSLNQAKDYVNFYIGIQDSIDVSKDDDVASILRDLRQSGVFAGSEGGLRVKEELTAREREQLERFQFLLIERLIFPEFIEKNPKRGSDWASEFIVQTAMYHIGTSYKAQFQLDRAIQVWNSLIRQYPETIYAEVLFLEIGKALLSEGQKQIADGSEREAERRFREAISYLEKIERNREIAERFPKYKYVDLEPGSYVNVDLASRAKSQVREKTSIYTTEQAEKELSGDDSDERSGYFLEDAVKLIGECYIYIGATDSARMQFSLLLEFFPESDNLDDAQKLIADSHMRDGDMALKSGDSSATNREKANEHYRLAVKEYLKFANVYPQSDLISENFIALGDAYNKLGEKDKARAAFASALGRAKEAEDQAKVQLQIGNYFYERDRLPEAIEAYGIILNNYLSTQVAPNAQYMLGQCYMAKGDTAEALKNYQVILDHYKNSNFLASAALHIGDRHFRSGNYRDAEKAYNTGWVYDQEGNLAPRMKFQIGAIWRKIAESQEGAAREKAYKDAIEHFKEVVDRFIGKAPEADQASLQIAQIYKELGNVEAAREASKRIQARDQMLLAMKLFRDDSTDSHESDKNYWEEAIAAAKDPEERAAAYYELAMVHAQVPEEYEQALKSFNQVLELTAKNSRRINAQVGIARVYAAQKEFDQAIALLDSLIENPKVGDELRQQLLIQLYDARYRSGDKDKALEGFESFVAELPDHKSAPLAYYRIGSILAEREEYGKAQDKYQIILDRYPESDMIDRAVLAIGDQMANLGKHEKAVKYLEEFIKDNSDVPTAPNFHMKIGELYGTHLDKKQKAIAAYGKVLEGEPENALYSHAGYRQGMLYKELGQDKNALDAFEKVRKEDKAVFRAARAEMGKLIAKTNPEKAIAMYREIVDAAESPEDSAIALIGIGDVYDEIKKPRQAAETFARVYETYSGSDTSLITGALVKWVNALINSKQYGSAISAANKMQKQFPDHPLTINTYYFEATAYFQQKKFANARKVFQRIIDLKRSEQLSEVAYYQIGDSYYFGQQFGPAVTAYANYIKNYPKGQYVARAIYMQGICYVSDQNWDGAVAKLSKVVRDYPKFSDMCTAKNYLALSLDKRDKPGDSDLAYKYYGQVLNGGCDAKAKEMARKGREDIKIRKM